MKKIIIFLTLLVFTFSICSAKQTKDKIITITGVGYARENMKASLQKQMAEESAMISLQSNFINEIQVVITKKHSGNGQNPVISSRSAIFRNWYKLRKYITKEYDPKTLTATLTLKIPESVFLKYVENNVKIMED